MELRHLRYFVAVGTELNFRRAAKKLFMEQPSLSRQIQQLEQEIGTLLFHREKRQIQLTPAGQVFLDEARQILAQVEQAARAARLASQQERHSLRVGLCLSLIPYSSSFERQFTRRVQAVREQESAIGLVLSDFNEPDLKQALQEDKIDVAFAHQPTGEDSLATQTVTREPLWLMLPPRHPLAVLSEVPLKSLRQENLFLFSEAKSPLFHRSITAACANADFQPKAVQATDSLQTTLMLVEAGLGVALVGNSFTAAAPHDIVLRPTQNFTGYCEIVALWQPDNNHSLLNAFVSG